MSLNRREFLALTAGSAVVGANTVSCLQNDSSKPILNADVCIYTGNASGIMAAVAAAQRGRSVIIVEQSRWLGGMCGGGIDEIDWGRPTAVGGSSRVLLGRPGKGISDHSEERFGNKDYRDRFKEIVKKHEVKVIYEHRLGNVHKTENRIQSIDLDYAPPGKTGIPLAKPLKANAITINSKIFIDCSYEGDLMVMTGVSYTYGRESTEQYGESLAGVRPILLEYDINPYLKPGVPESGLLPLLQDIEIGPLGSADKLTMGYCFRYEWKFEGERHPLTPTDSFDPNMFEMFRRGFDKGINMTTDRCMKYILDNYSTWGGTGKYGPFNNNAKRCLLTHTVYGSNMDYPDGDWEPKSRIWQFHQDYVRNLAHFLRTDPSVPQDMKETAVNAGLSVGDFEETEGWPHHLYVREARRMVSSYVVTQDDMVRKKDPYDSVGLASYGLDDFPFATIANNGKIALSGGELSIVYIGDGLRNTSEEGDLFISPGAGMYKIPYRSITPFENECSNLIVPVCCSASHIVMTSLRMEPVWMILGESAGVAAHLAIEEGGVVQEVNNSRLRNRLLELDQILDIPT